MNLTYLITNKSITVNIGGETHIIPSSHQFYDKLLSAIKCSDENEITSLVSTAKYIETKSSGQFKVVDGEIYVDGKNVRGPLGKKIIAFIEEELPFEPLIEFARKLRNNPSQASIDQLYSFLEKNEHPITPNGNFIAYKKICPPNADGVMLDIHSKTVNNNPGETPTIPRDQVDPDPTRTCSSGLHVANWDYAKNSFGSYNDVLVEVEVDPADVVAVPIDYNQAKMRTCKYYVRKVINAPQVSTTMVDLEAKRTKDGMVMLEEDEKHCDSCGCHLNEHRECPVCDCEDECSEEGCEAEE